MIRNVPAALPLLAALLGRNDVDDDGLDRGISLVFPPMNGARLLKRRIAGLLDHRPSVPTRCSVI